MLSYQVPTRIKIIYLLIIVGFALRILWVVYFPTDLYADSAWYYQQALNLSQGKGYVYNGAPSAIWPVGYPFFLSLIFKLVPPTQLTAKFINVMLLTFDLWLIFQYTRLSASSYLAPYLAMLLMSFMPTYIFAGGIVATEPLFACLLHFGLLIVLLALKKQRDWLWLVTGGVTGGMVYIRAEAVAFLPVVLFFYVISRPAVWSTKWQRIHGTLLLMIAIALIMITPWTIRNYIKLGLFVPISTTGCMNMWIGHVPYSDGGYYWSNDPTTNPTIFLEGDTEQTWYRRSCQAAIQLIRAAPLQAVILWPKKIFKLWQDDRGILHWHLSGTIRRVSSQEAEFLYTIANSYYYVILFTGLTGVIWQIAKSKFWRIYRGRQIWAIEELCGAVGFITILSFTGIYLPFFGASRFHFALVPLLAVYAVDFLVTASIYIKIRLFY